MIAQVVELKRAAIVIAQHYAHLRRKYMFHFWFGDTKTSAAIYTKGIGLLVIVADFGVYVFIGNNGATNQVRIVVCYLKCLARKIR